MSDRERLMKAHDELAKCAVALIELRFASQQLVDRIFEATPAMAEDLPVNQIARIDPFVQRVRALLPKESPR
jgi:hypothetical protein